MANKYLFLLGFGLLLVTCLIVLIRLILKERREDLNEENRIVFIEAHSDGEMREYYNEIFRKTIKSECIEYLNSQNEEKKMDLLLIIERKLKKEGIDFNAVMKYFNTYLDSFN